jgi:hypothetical protein
MRITVIEYPQGDRIVVLNGEFIYAEDPADKGCFNNLYHSLEVADRLGKALGKEVESVALPAEMAESSYEDAVGWLNQQPRETTNPQRATVIGQLEELAQDNEVVPFVVDDLCSDNPGTGNITNDGVEVLVGRTDLAETTTAWQGVVEEHSGAETAGYSVVAVNLVVATVDVPAVTESLQEWYESHEIGMEACRIRNRPATAKETTGLDRSDDLLAEFEGNARDEALFEQAAEGLTESYPEVLGNRTLVEQIRAKVAVPNTGNDQDDYKSVRTQVERLAEAYQMDGPR